MLPSIYYKAQIQAADALGNAITWYYQHQFVLAGRHYSLINTD